MSEANQRIIAAALALTSQLDLPDVLQDLVDTAAELTGARYTALGVLDHAGRAVVFVYHGLTPNAATRLGHPPSGEGVLGAIPDDDALMLEDLTMHPDFRGFPEGHPPMYSFLGLPLRLKEQVYGRLYLTEKDGGFTEEDVENMRVLASAAVVAIVNSRIYGQARARERWMRVSQEITTTLLEGTEEEEALQLIAQRVRDVADADTCLIILPSVGDSWACEIADGVAASELIGIEFPHDGRALNVLREGMGVLVDSLAAARPMRVPNLRRFGPALYAPMVVRGAGLGIILVLRLEGRQEFETSDLAMAESLAQQAALALELAASRHAQDVASLLEERERIGRDLHDLAIQQLFATGMHLDAARKDVAKRGMNELEVVLESSLTAVDESVRQIRAIVQSLREPDEDVVLVGRLQREASIGRTALGFAPSMVVSVDGVPVEDWSVDPDLSDALDHRVGADITDDVVAVVREGLSNAARHAHASSVQVRVSVWGRGTTGVVSIEVEDDGVGVDGALSRRSGLDNLAQRARRHHGEFTLMRGELGTGTLLAWRVPLR